MTSNRFIPIRWRAIDPSFAHSREEEAFIAWAVDHHEHCFRKE